MQTTFNNVITFNMRFFNLFYHIYIYLALCFSFSWVFLDISSTICKAQTGIFVPKGNKKEEKKP